ncbi:MAG TPA: hypothetical protein VNT99_05505 [Methylomirabilota bacterium]|nr:hypothetical protein [Methylomirabilota bacterium]
MSHLENLIIEYYRWCGCDVRHNQKVGPRERGGWEMELDVIVHDAKNSTLLHLEPSLDAMSWAKREARFTKKFEAGRKYIPTDIFPSVPSSVKLEQIAILISAGPARQRLAGADVWTVDEMVARIRDSVRAKGIAARAAIPEQFPLLRTIQFVTSGYYGVVEAAPEWANQTPETNRR